MTAAATLSAAEVAALLGLSRWGFYRRLPALRLHGFPSPLPGLRRYSRAAVLRWVEGGGAAPAASAEATLIERARVMGAI